MENNKKIPVFEYMEKAECCGCENCVNVCPIHIIGMEPDTLGFRYPEHLKDTCIHCNQCVKVCPQLKKVDEAKQNRTIAGYCGDPDVVYNSSSGGFFYILATTLLGKRTDEIKWHVAGVKWNDTFSYVHHSLIDNVQELEPLMRSKYIQSRKEDISKQIEAVLKKGDSVLFCGTPCEVAAICTIIPEKLQGNLYTIDVVCQGATSEKAWIQFKTKLEKRYHAIIKCVNMRLPFKTWIPQHICVQFQNGKEFKHYLYETPFGDAVRLMQREACYNCHFPTTSSVADITLGDYHGMDTGSKLYNPKGVSIAVAHTEKGQYLMNILQQSNAVLQEDDFLSIAQKNVRMLHPWPHREGYDVFVKEFVQNGLFCAARKTIGYKGYIRRFLPELLLEKYVKLKKLIRGKGK